MKRWVEHKRHTTSYIFSIARRHGVWNQKIWSAPLGHAFRFRCNGKVREIHLVGFHVRQIDNIVTHACLFPNSTSHTFRLMKSKMRLKLIAIHNT